MNFDKLFNEIGSCGRYQVFLIFACIWSMIPIACNISAVIFLGYPESHRCAVSDNNTDHTYNQSQVAKPSVSSQDSISCSTVLFNYTATVNYSNQHNNEPVTAPCTYGYHYDREIFEQTIRTEWDLVCEHSHFNSIATALFCLGMLLGSVFGGSIADKYGRIPTMVVGTILNVAVGVGCAFSPNFITFITLRCLIGTFCVVVQIAMATYTVEIVGKKYRSWVGLLLGVFSGAGYMTLSAIAFLFRRWRTIQLILGLIFIPFLLVAPIIPESPRILLAHKKFDKARKVCDKIAQKNGRTLTEKSWEELKSSARIAQKRKSFNVTRLFKSFSMCSLLIKVIIQWFVNGLIFFCLSFNVGHWSGNPFLNNALSGLVELIACLVIVPIINKIGRRNTVMGSLLVAGIAISVAEILLYIPALKDTWSLSVSLLLIAKFTIGGSFNLLFLYTAELFPTEARNTALGISTIGGRAASIVAPFLIEVQHIGSWILSLILGVIAIGSAFLAWNCPETKKLLMFSTLKEAKFYYNKNKSKLLINNNLDSFTLPVSDETKLTTDFMKESDL